MKCMFCVSRGNLSLARNNPFPTRFKGGRVLLKQLAPQSLCLCELKRYAGKCLSFWNISSLFNLKTCRQAPRCQEVCHENITSLDRIALFLEQICFWFLYIQKLSKLIILDASQSQVRIFLKPNTAKTILLKFCVMFLAFFNLFSSSIFLFSCSSFFFGFLVLLLFCQVLMSQPASQSCLIVANLRTRNSEFSIIVNI